jgi:uncharacterized protein
MRSVFFVILFLAQLCLFAVPGEARSGGDVFRSAELGDANAQARLGHMYEMGRGVPQNYRLATYWYLRAANQGHTGAQYLLGFMFDRGFGVPADHIEAEKWMILAAGGARAPRDADVFVRMRNAIATKLTRSEKAEAQFRAEMWAPVRER